MFAGHASEARARLSFCPARKRCACCVQTHFAVTKYSKYLRVYLYDRFSGYLDKRTMIFFILSLSSAFPIAIIIIIHARTFHQKTRKAICSILVEGNLLSSKRI